MRAVQFQFHHINSSFKLVYVRSSELNGKSVWNTAMILYIAALFGKFLKIKYFFEVPLEMRNDVPEIAKRVSFKFKSGDVSNDR